MAMIKAAKGELRVSSLAAVRLFDKKPHLGHQLSTAELYPGIGLANSNTTTGLPVCLYDSVSRSRSWNRYAYVSGIPLRSIDKSGEDDTCGPDKWWTGEGCTGGGAPSATGYEASTTTSYCTLGACTSANIANSASATYNPYAVYATILGKFQQVVTGSMLGTTSGDLTQGYSQYTTWLASVGPALGSWVPDPLDSSQLNFVATIRGGLPSACVASVQAAIGPPVTPYEAAQNSTQTYGGFASAKPPGVKGVGGFVWQLITAAGTPYSAPPAAFSGVPSASTVALGQLSSQASSESAAAVNTQISMLCH